MAARSKKINKGDTPLKVKVEGQELVVRIGIDTLAFAAEHCPKFYDYDVHQGEDGPYVKVDDKKELAGDIVRALTHEEEDGSSPLSEMLDSAIEWAFNDGSIGFAEESYPQMPAADTST